MVDKGEKKNPFSGIINYFKDVKGEIKKVFYPTVEAVRNNTIIVIVTILIFGVVVWSFDFAFATMRRVFIENQPISMPQTDVQPSLTDEEGNPIDLNSLVQEGAPNDDGEIEIVPGEVAGGENSEASAEGSNQ